MYQHDLSATARGGDLMVLTTKPAGPPRICGHPQRRMACRWVTRSGSRPQAPTPPATRRMWCTGSLLLRTTTTATFSATPKTDGLTPGRRTAQDGYWKRSSARSVEFQPEWYRKMIPVATTLSSTGRSLLVHRVLTTTPALSITPLKPITPRRLSRRCLRRSRG